MLAMRAEAFTGLGRREEARSAWGVAADRFEEAGDKKGAASARARLEPELEPGPEPEPRPQPEAAVAVQSPAVVVEAAPEPAPTTKLQAAQVTNLDANGTGA